MKKEKLRGALEVLSGCFLFGFLGVGAAALLLYTPLEKGGLALLLCLALPIPLLLLLLLGERRWERWVCRKGPELPAPSGTQGGWRAVWRTVFLCGGALLLYGSLFAVYFHRTLRRLIDLWMFTASAAAAYFAFSLLLLRLLFAGIFALLTALQRKSPPKGKERETSNKPAGKESPGKKGGRKK